MALDENGHPLGGGTYTPRQLQTVSANKPTVATAVLVTNESVRELIDTLVGEKLVLNKGGLRIFQGAYKTDSREGIVYNLVANQISRVKQKLSNFGGGHASWEEYTRRPIQILEGARSYTFGQNSIVKITAENSDFLYARFDDIFQPHTGCEIFSLTEKELLTNAAMKTNGKLSHGLTGGILSVRDIERSAAPQTISADTYVHFEARDFCIVKDSILEYIRISDDGKSYETISGPFDLTSYGKIGSIAFDHNRNFLAFAAEQGGVWKTSLVSRRDFKVIADFLNITQVLTFNASNDLLVLDTNRAPALIDTNFNNFAPEHTGAILRAEERQVTKIEDMGVTAAIEAIRIGRVQPVLSQANGISENSLMSEIWSFASLETNNKPLRELFHEAKSLGDIASVELILTAMRSVPEIVAAGGALSDIEKVVHEKKQFLLLQELHAKGDAIRAEVPQGVEVLDIVALIEMKERLNQLIHDRRRINIASNDHDRELHALFLSVSETLDRKRDTEEQTLLREVEISLQQLSTAIKSVLYSEDLKHVYSDPAYGHIDTLMRFLSQEKQKEISQRRQSLFDARRSEFIASERVVLAQKVAREEELKRILLGHISEIEKILKHESDPLTVAKIRDNHPLSMGVRTGMSELSTTAQQEVDAAFQGIFQDALTALKYREGAKQVITVGDYGIPNILKYQSMPKKVHWEWLAERMSDGRIQIVFQDSLGHRLDADTKRLYRSERPFSFSPEEFSEIEKSFREWASSGKKKYSQLRLERARVAGSDESEYARINAEIHELQKKYHFPRMLDTLDKLSSQRVKWFGRDKSESRPLLPKIHPKTVIGPSIENFLKEMGFALEWQIEKGAGIAIVQSDAGTGKNFKIELFAALTNRELFTFSCNQRSEKEDLLYSQEIGKSGTYRLASGFVRAIQTPGTVVCLDEINTLPPGISKLLNPLFDGQRSIYDPQLGRIRVHPSVVFVGAMNPATYIGTNPLPQEFASRATFISDDYPAEYLADKQTPSSEEAFLLSRHMKGGVGKMEYAAFNKLWTDVVVKGKTGTGDVGTQMRDLRSIVAVLGNLRRAYRTTMEGRSNGTNELHLVATIREGIDIVGYRDRLSNVREALEKVLLPKVGTTHKDIDVIAEQNLIRSMIDKSTT